MISACHSTPFFNIPPNREIQTASKHKVQNLTNVTTLYQHVRVYPNNLHNDIRVVAPNLMMKDNNLPAAAISAACNHTCEEL